MAVVKTYQFDIYKNFKFRWFNKMTKFVLSVLFLCSCFFYSYASPLFPDHDINDPTLSKNVVGMQCRKSLMYAPDKLESWCEKSYKMGDWQALRLIGVHTGDGSRYVAEATKRADDGELSAISSLAWIYYSGNFVPVDYPKAISLYEEYISKANNQYKNKKNEAHKRLYSIYQELDNVKEAEKHKRYLDENDDINANE